jgi:hypothetical protein
MEIQDKISKALTDKSYSTETKSKMNEVHKKFFSKNTKTKLSNSISLFI